MPAQTQLGRREVCQSPSGGAASESLHGSSRSQSAASAIVPLLLTDEQAAAYWNVSLRTFNTLQLQPWFPAPVMLGPRMKRHVRHELDAATAKMPRQTERVQPESLVRAKIERMKSQGVPA